jgi:hypothetical protein
MYPGRGDGEGGVEVGVEEAMRAMQLGFTVIMNGVQSSMPNVYQSAWQLETALGWHVNVNLYISPPGGSQGFEAHLDWMDGFIFQVSGLKVGRSLKLIRAHSLTHSKSNNPSHMLKLTHAHVIHTATHIVCNTSVVAKMMTPSRMSMFC